MKRRYRIGKEVIYDRFFNNFLMESKILNNQSSILNFESYDEKGIKKNIAQIIGFKNGKYFSNDKPVLAILPSLENEHKQIHNEFKNFQQRQVNEGNRRPTIEPPELLEKRLKIEANIDVTKTELTLLEKKLEEFENKVVKANNENVLKYGVKGSGKLRNGVLCEVDGQKISLTREKILVIDDKRSCYNGMLTADYFEKIVKPWGKAKSKLNNLLRKKEQHLAAIKDEQILKKISEYKKELFEKNLDWKKLFVKMMPGKPLIPSWPVDVKKFE